MIDRLIRRFSVWFSSSGAVWQTTVLVLVWVIAEQVFPQSDPHGFVLLYVLTVYSAITQPALAFASDQAASEAARATGAARQMLQNQTDTMEAVAAILERMDDNVTQMRHYDAADARDLDEILAFVREVRRREGSQETEGGAGSA